MKEILDNWFATSITEGAAQTEWNNQQMQRIRDLEEKYAA
jgi:hypothetical protein